MATPARFGGLALPVTLPAGEAPGDPALTVLLAYLQAVLNARANTAWAQLARAPGLSPLVRGIHTHDPADLEFAEPQTPALYAWREDGQSERLAADYEVQTSRLVVEWVAPAASDEQLQKRDPFLNAIAKVVHAALRSDADPAWVAPGDTDPRAAAEGSLVWKLAGIFRQGPGPVRWKRTTVNRQTAETGDTARYPALRFDLEIQERLVLTTPPALAALAAQLKLAATPPLLLLSLQVPKP